MIAKPLLYLCCVIALIHAGDVFAGHLHHYSGSEAGNAIEGSCLVLATLPLDSVEELLTAAVSAYRDEISVQIGYIHLDSFVWPSGKRLRASSATKGMLPIGSDQPLYLIPKIQVDRTCLLQTDILWYPDAEAYSGPLEMDTFVNFINHHCGTFRNTAGEKSILGLHRDEILQNLFSTEAVSGPTIGDLYQLHDNPFNSSFYCMTPSKVPGHSATCHRKDRFMQDEQPLTMAQCERIQVPPTEAEFFEKYLKKSRPFILENAAKTWPAFTKWSNDHLRNLYANVSVHIKLTPTGDFEGVEPASLWEDFDTFEIPYIVRSKLGYPDLVVVRPAGVNMNFSEFLDLIESTADAKDPNLSAYLEYSSIPQYLPSLEDDVSEPEFVQGLLKRAHLNIWLSDGNTLGRLHFDPHDNLLTQLSGKKQFILFEPHHNDRLYESHIPEATLTFNKKSRKFRRIARQDTTSMVMSPVDLLNPDFQRFPKFAETRPMNCTLSGGDILYMPAFWWHEVQSSPSPTELRNLAVNFWYEPFLKKEFPCAECQLDVNPLYHHLLLTPPAS